MKHTQGPWYWSSDYQARDLSDTWSLIGKDGYGVLSCDGNGNSPPEINNADANLIAAAPEMLEALLEADEQFELEGYDPEGPTRSIIRAAIRKATGSNNGNRTADCSQT